MDLMQYQLTRLPYQDSLKLLETDIQHANSLCQLFRLFCYPWLIMNEWKQFNIRCRPHQIHWAAAIPRAKGGTIVQMKLVYNHLAPVFLFLLQWMDCSCVCLLHRYLNLFHLLIYKVHKDGRLNVSTHGRKATIKDFYAVILPSLQRLHCSCSLGKLEISEEGQSSIEGERIEVDGRVSNVDLEREDECGICLEPCTRMVLPNCCHAMCIKCYRKWNTRSESCPFCRGSLRRVNSEDLWVLTCNEDVVDAETVSKEDLLRFYLYINSLPKDYPDALFIMYYEYLI